MHLGGRVLTCRWGWWGSSSHSHAEQEIYLALRTVFVAALTCNSEPANTMVSFEV